MREIESADELLNKAFELAYFILGDRSASIYVAMAAMDKLKTALSNQGRRLYYTPTGRSAAAATRTKVNLSELHLLQRLVYIESELFERLIEAQGITVQQDDLIIRYVKHLIRITTKHNSFYVTLGLCRLLYNYSTADTSEIYNLVLQDPERIRDDYYYRSRKQRLMQQIKERFGSLVRTQRGFRGEERFEPQEDSKRYLGLVRDCLTRFTPWHSPCVLPRELDPKTSVIPQLLFDGADPDKEHQVELGRIHSLIHPECLGRLTSALGLPPTDERLELPSFYLSGASSRPAEDRFKPSLLTEGELDAIRRYLDKNTVHRKQFAPGQLALLIDGKRQADFELSPSRRVNFNLLDGSELIEIRSVLLDEESDAPVALSLLRYDQSGVVAGDSSLLVGGGQQLSIKIAPSIGASGEAEGAMLSLGFEAATSTRSIPAALLRFAVWRKGLIDFHGGSYLPKLAVALLFVALSISGLWFYFHSSERSADSLRVAKLDNRGEATRPAPPASMSQPAQTGTPSPRNKGLESQPGLSQRAGPGGVDESKERVRGTEPRPASVLLLAIKRVYVDPLGDDSFSHELREKLITALQSSGRFELVENRDEADAVFRGSAKQVPNGGPAIVLELVNASGQGVWSLSSRKNGKPIPRDPTDTAATIVKILLNDIRMRERDR